MMPNLYDGTMTRQETIKRGDGVAIWRQIAERLRTEISLDVWKTDDRLPSESELAIRFGVNRHTVRRAVATLAEEGILQANQGRGTFVAQKPISYPISARTRFSEIVSAQAREPGGKLISRLTEPADDSVAEKLGVSPGTLLLRVESIRFADAVPISWGVNYYPSDRFPTLAEAFERTGSITDALRENGLRDYTRRETTISAESALALDAERLDVAVGDPLLTCEAINDDPNGFAFNLTFSRMAASRVQLKIDS